MGNDNDNGNASRGVVSLTEKTVSVKTHRQAIRRAAESERHACRNKCIDAWVLVDFARDAVRMASLASSMPEAHARALRYLNEALEVLG